LIDNVLISFGVINYLTLGWSMVMKEDEINSFIEHNTLFKKKLPLLKGHVLFKGVYGLNDVEEETQDAR
jgi:hypothetical protein